MIQKSIRIATSLTALATLTVTFASAFFIAENAGATAGVIEGGAGSAAGNTRGTTGVTVKTKEFLSGVLCREAVDAQLKAIGATREWSQLSARELDGSRRFFSPTNVIGVWAEARVFMNKEVELRRITANFTEIRTFDLKTCKPNATAEKQRLFFKTPAAGDEVFTDRDLRELLSKNDRGIIYIWSPHMPFSYRALNERVSGVEAIREVARKLGMHLTVVVDPAANQLFTRKLVSENRSLLLGSTVSPTRRAQSLELSFRAMNTHFPVLITYAKGRIARHAYPGVGTEKEYSKIVSKQMAELE